MNLNSEFQTLVESLHTSFDRSALVGEIEDVVLKFQSVATSLARKLINMEESTRSNFVLKGKGIAGGEKFLLSGIFFKFARDDKNLYGGDMWAQKVAGHELKSMIEIMNLEIPNLFVPLACLIDFQGHRIMAMSCLPIDASTLVYGSSDGGLTFHNQDTEARNIIQRIASELNLKNHIFRGHQVSCCVDTEIHRTSDGRLYILDVSRFFPPVWEENSTKTSIFYNLMRPEFIRQYKIPLSSDSLSSFSSTDPDRYQHNSEVIEASTFLRTDTIRQCAEGLIFATLKKSHSWCIDLIHRYGVNLRYLPELISKCPESPEVTKILQIEMVARCLKSILHQIWRSYTPNGLSHLEEGDRARLREECFTFLAWSFFKTLSESPHVCAPVIEAFLHAKFIPPVKLSVLIFLPENWEKILRRTNKLLNCQPLDHSKRFSMPLITSSWQTFVQSVSFPPLPKTYPIKFQSSSETVFTLKGFDGLKEHILKMKKTLRENVLSDQANFFLHDKIAHCLLLMIKHSSNRLDFTQVQEIYISALLHLQVCSNLETLPFRFKANAMFKTVYLSCSLAQVLKAQSNHSLFLSVYLIAVAILNEAFVYLRTHSINATTYHQFLSNFHDLVDNRNLRLLLQTNSKETPKISSRTHLKMIDTLKKINTKGSQDQILSQQILHCRALMFEMEFAEAKKALQSLKKSPTQGQNSSQIAILEAQFSLLLHNPNCFHHLQTLERIIDKSDIKTFYFLYALYFMHVGDQTNFKLTLNRVQESANGHRDPQFQILKDRFDLVQFMKEPNSWVFPQSLIRKGFFSQFYQNLNGKLLKAYKVTVNLAPHLSLLCRTAKGFAFFQAFFQEWKMRHLSHVYIFAAEDWGLSDVELLLSNSPEHDSVFLVFPTFQCTLDELFSRPNLLSNQKASISLQILKAIEYLQNAGIIHHNLCSQNIFIQDIQAPKIKIGDFALSQFSDSYQIPPILNPWTLGEEFDIFSTDFEADHEVSPCVANGFQRGRKIPSDIFKIDVFAFGILLWEIENYSTLASTQPTATTSEIRQFLREKSFLSTVQDPKLRTIIETCLSPPGSRPSIKELKGLLSSDNFFSTAPTNVQNTADFQIQTSMEKIVALLLQNAVDREVLHQCCKDDSLISQIALSWLIEAGASINSLSKSGTSPLIQAMKSTCHEQFLKLISVDTLDIEKRDVFGDTPLAVAIKLGNERFCEELLRKKANINNLTARHENALGLSCQIDNYPLAKLFFELDPLAIDTMDFIGETPLFYACTRGNAKIAQFLLHHKADVNLSNVFGSSVMIAAAESGNPTLLQILANVNKNLLNRAQHDKTTPLLKAVETGHEQAVQTLLSLSANPQQKNEKNVTPLELAGQKNYSAIYHLLQRFQ